MSGARNFDWRTPLFLLGLVVFMAAVYLYIDYRPWSEAEIRHYESFQPFLHDASEIKTEYSSTDHWGLVFSYQTSLPDESFVDAIRTEAHAAGWTELEPGLHERRHDKEASRFLERIRWQRGEDGRVWVDWWKRQLRDNEDATLRDLQMDDWIAEPS